MPRRPHRIPAAALLAALAFLAILLPSKAARADAWAKTFVAAAVSTYVPANAGVLVVPAGRSVQAAEAARALKEALESSRPKGSVFDEKALGPGAEGLDDRTLVQRAGNLPVQAIATVRVFPSGGRESAVITIYDRENRVISAFTATKGAPLQPGSGVVNKVSLAEPAPLLPSNPESQSKVPMSDADAALAAARAAARAEYDQRYVGFMNLAGATDVLTPSSWPTPFRSSLQRALYGETFYEAIEQPELAERYRQRRRKQIGLVAGGGAIAGVGILVGLSIALVSLDKPGTECTDWDPVQQHCFNYATDQSGVAAGLTVVGLSVAGGLAVSLVGVFMNPHPVSLDEARVLTDEYNRKLRREVGLDGPVSEAPRPAGPRFGWTVAPSVGPTGGGLSVLGRF